MAAVWHALSCSGDGHLLASVAPTRVSESQGLFYGVENVCQTERDFAKVGRRKSLPGEMPLLGGNNSRCASLVPARRERLRNEF